MQDLSTPNLISAIEGNLFAFILAMRKWPQGKVHDDAEILWSMTEIPFPLFNGIMRAHLTPERIDPVIESITAQARSRNVPLLWWTGPATQPADLGSYLEKHGFLNGGQSPGMAIDLGKLNAHPPMPNGFSIQPVNDDETLKQWTRVCVKGFGMPDFVGECFYDLMHYVDQVTVRAYLGWLDGKPVATSLFILAAGVVGIYNVTTLPSARRKGIGARMTDFPLLQLRTMGYKVSVLNASEMGKSVYRSIGFQEYCKIGQYLWSPPR